MDVRTIDRGSPNDLFSTLWWITVEAYDDPLSRIPVSGWFVGPKRSASCSAAALWLRLRISVR